MNYFPSPPSSPQLSALSANVICGACNKALGADWFCSDCHRKCTTCNRFLGEHEYCTRCWSFDLLSQQFYRKAKYYFSTSTFTGLPTPSSSTESNISSTHHEPKLLTRPFTYKF